MYYREWKSIVTGENSQEAQIQNLKKLMNIWQRSSDSDKDCVAIGDMNLCALSVDIFIPTSPPLFTTFFSLKTVTNLLMTTPGLEVLMEISKDPAWTI